MATPIMKNAPLILVVGVMIFGSALAQSESEPNTVISLGVFVTDQDMDTKLESDLGDESDLDFEKDLGLDASLSVFRFDATHRFGKKHRISASVFDLSRQSTATIEGEIEWQDTVFPISTQIRTDLDFTIYKLAYVYDFMRRENATVGASFGFYTADIDLLIRNENTLESETGDVTAPLPVVGLRGHRALGDRWTAAASAEVFFANFDDVDGFLYDVAIGVDYWLSDRTAIGLAWNAVELDVDARSENLNADLVWSYSGALLSFKVGF